MGTKNYKSVKRILMVILLTLITGIAMSRTTFKKVKEAKGLQVGDSIANFTAKDLHENTYNLYDALKKGPVVLVFYRGQWCPFCNKHLKALQDSLEQIYEKGATVVAVSPEKSEFLKRTADKTKASFSLLYDENYAISNLFDVTFEPKGFEKTLYNGMLGAKLKESHSDDTQRLPIPATFIIDKNAKVVWRHFDPDYKKRSSMKDILLHLP